MQKNELLKAVARIYMKLRPSEQRVADLVLNDSAKFNLLSTSDVAVIANVSEATISRLCKSLNLTGIRQLREVLQT